jgi:hypothetical protein
MAIPTNVELDDLLNFMNTIGLSMEQVLCREEPPACLNVEVVDEWQREYRYGRSLYNPSKLKELHTQMYKLHEWYMSLCAKHENEQYISV